MWVLGPLILLEMTVWEGKALVFRVRIAACGKTGPVRCCSLKCLVQSRAALESQGSAFKITRDLTATVLKMLSLIKSTLNG